MAKPNSVEAGVAHFRSWILLDVLHREHDVTVLV
jgi:hypothetical protein